MNTSVPAPSPHCPTSPTRKEPGLPPAPVRRRAAGLPPPELLSAVLDQLDTGVLLLDGGGFVLLANDAARVEMGQGGVLRIDEAGLVDVHSAPSLLALRAALDAAITERLRQLLTLRAGVCSLTVAVQPLRLPGHAPLAMLLLQRRQLCPDVVVEMLASQHALTLAERRILAGLLGGQRVAALAAAHGVQVSTVRSQAASLRHKFGVRRLEDLTRLAAELPPMAPALQGMFARGPAAAAPNPQHRPGLPEVPARVARRRTGR